MPVVGDLIVNLRARNAQFNQQFKGSATTVERSAERIQRAGDRMARIGRTISLGLSAPLGLVAGNAIRMAASVEESEQLFGVAMGRMEGRARKFSKNLQEQFGLNAFAINRMVGTFNLMFQGMDIAEEGALAMSTALTQLTLDMASLRNESIDDVFIKISAAITGQVEPLRRFGIIIQETTAEAALLKRELIEQGEVLTEQQKIYGRFLAILDQSKADTGDLARTILSTTNQWRVFRERIALANVEIGNVFLPVVNAALRVMNALAKQFLGLDDATKVWIATIALSVTALGPLILITGLLIKSFGFLLPIFGKMVLGIGVLIGAVGLLALAWDDTRTKLRQLFISDEQFNKWNRQFEEAFGVNPARVVGDFIESMKMIPGKLGDLLASLPDRIRARLEEVNALVRDRTGRSIVENFRLMGEGIRNAIRTLPRH